MQLLCPECRGMLVSTDGLSATCAVHGGKYQILFSRHAFPAAATSVVTPVPTLSAGAVCTRHPGVTAAFACNICAKPICNVCDFAQPDGGHRCPDCAQRGAIAAPVLAPPVQSFPAGVRCVQHVNLNATAQCKICGAFMCSTCAFELPGGIKICPSCATNPRTAISPKRKRMLIASFGLAGWCTMVLAAMFAGVFHGMSHSKADQEALGYLLMFILIVPSMIGLAMGLGCIDRRLSNNMTMWIATVWNGLILGGFILLIIVGLLRQ